LSGNLAPSKSSPVGETLAATLIVAASFGLLDLAPSKSPPVGETLAATLIAAASFGLSPL